MPNFAKAIRPYVTQEINVIAARQKICFSISALCCRKLQPGRGAACLGRGIPFHYLGVMRNAQNTVGRAAPDRAPGRTYA
jgi:hypothetical protein